MLTQDHRLVDESLGACLAALDLGLATSAQIRSANAWRLATRPQIGKLALKRGELTISQVFEILAKQADSGELFGKIAVDMGYLTNEALFGLLESQSELTPTLTEALVATNALRPDQAAQVSKHSFADLPASTSFKSIGTP